MLVVDVEYIGDYYHWNFGLVITCCGVQDAAGLFTGLLMVHATEECEWDNIIDYKIDTFYFFLIVLELKLICLVAVLKPPVS
jgi:hypothetical protein